MKKFRAHSGRLLLLALFSIAFALGSASVSADSEYFSEFSGEIRFESRWFPDDGAYGQSRNANGFVIEPRFYIENEKGWSFNLAPYYRYDNQDDEREHAVLKEAYFLLFGELEDSEWEIRLGVDHVFWGVAEVTNIVDIINQWDAVEDPFGKVKLGQLMTHLTLSGDWGVAELFYMPEHELRTYPGVDGRLRALLAVDNSLATYESSDGDDHDDFAVRFSRTIGPADVGFSVFDGTGREPSIRLGADGSGAPVFIPHYEQIRQYGLDIGMPVGEFLFKLEAVNRRDSSNLLLQKENYSAYLLGGEYTFYSVFESALDVTIFGEWIRDDRGARSTSPLQDELFLAGRIALNDINGTELTVSLLEDLDYDSQTLSFEFKRRLTDDWALEIEGVEFVNSDPADIVQYPTRQDGYINVSVSYGF